MSARKLLSERSFTFKRNDKFSPPRECRRVNWARMFIIQEENEEEEHMRPPITFHTHTYVNTHRHTLYARRFIS